MHMCKFRIPCTATLWTLSITLMVVSADLDDRALAAASILTALVACVPSMWLIAEHVSARAERRVIRAVCEAIGYAEAKRDLSRLH